MAYFKIYDREGNLTIDESSRLAKILGCISTGTQNGSFYDKNLIGNDHWYFVSPCSTPSFNYSPEVKIKDGLISWTFVSKPLSSHTIIYGIY